MYDKKTQQFKFPYSQQRVNGVLFIAKNEMQFHNTFVDIRNEYYVNNKPQIKSHLDYWDIILNRSQANIADMFCGLLLYTDIVVKGGEDVN